MHAYNFLVYGPKFTKFLTPNVGVVVVDYFLFRFCYVDLLQSYLRSKSKVVRNRTEF